MNLIVLAAGKGNRLGKFTQKIPKVLLPLIEEKTILDFHLAYAHAAGAIEKTIIVSGFGDKYIRNFVREHPLSNQIDICFNPFYGLSGPLGSIWAIKDRLLEDDFILCNGDTFFETEFYNRFNIENSQGIYLGIDTSKSIVADDMKVILADGRVLNVSKSTSVEDADGVSTGMIFIAGLEARRSFVNALWQLVGNEENLIKNVPWHQIVNELAKRNSPVNAVDMSDLKWHEVDTPDDLDISEKILNRFSHLTDDLL